MCVFVRVCDRLSYDCYGRLVFVQFQAERIITLVHTCCSRLEVRSTDCTDCTDCTILVASVL